MSPRNKNWAHRGAAMLCLMAVALLYAPYAGAAWYTTQHLCCADGLCEVHGHQHAMAKSGDEMPMDCGHGMSHMSACKMSYCKTSEQAAINPQVFILPVPHLQMEAAPAISQVARQKAQSLSQYEKPQSPPPRFVVA